MSTEKLLLDLGGTNLRVGYGNDENLTIRDVSKVRVDSNEDIFKVVNNSINENNINEIVFSAAGPRIENKISMTNRSLDLDGDLLAHELKIKNCFLLNDWESIGYSLPLMTSEDISTVKDGDIKSCQTSIAIGPGTGLGFSLLTYVDGKPHIHATELGNTRSRNPYLADAFKITNTEDFKVLEDYISGTGLRKIYKSRTGEEKTAEEILSSYDTDKYSKEIVDTFVISFSTILADLSLSFMATGGVYFAGSLMRSLTKMSCIELMEKSFKNHPSKTHSDILERIPLYMIQKEHTPLYGNLNYSKLRRVHD